MRQIAWHQLCWIIGGMLAMCQALPVYPDVYAFSGEDGTVHLSNVPVDNNFVLFLEDPGKRANAVPEYASSRVVSVKANQARYLPMIKEVARDYQLETALLHAVIAVESGYNPAAVSRKGAKGLMQLMPGTARRYGVLDVSDPAQNIRGGARYLKDLLQLFNNDLKLSLAAYNAGEEAVIKYGNRIPPYRETAAYVPRVMDLYRKYQAGM